MKVDIYTTWNGNENEDAFITSYEVHVFKQDSRGGQTISMIAKLIVLDMRGTDGMNRSPQSALFNTLNTNIYTKELLRVMDYREGAVYGISGKLKGLTTDNALKRILCITRLELFGGANGKDEIEVMMNVLNQVIDLSEGFICHPYGALSDDSAPNQSVLSALVSNGFKDTKQAELMALSSVKQSKFNKNQIRRDVTRKRKLV